MISIVVSARRLNPIRITDAGKVYNGHSKRGTLDVDRSSVNDIPYRQFDIDAP